jgi:iron(III) transport system ATP-binding protein
MVFQSYAIWPHMSVFENVAYPLRVQRAPRADIERRVMDSLRLVAMQDYAQRPAPALSGGQQQRVAIARALVGEPSVLLLDEPLSNLDAKLRVQMGEEFRALQRRLGITTIYVTHDQEEAMTLSDRIVLMTAGRISQSGPPSELYRHPVDATVARFFGSPNMIPARVIASEGTVCRVSVLGSEVSCRAARSLRPGEAVEVVVRPEDIELAPEGTAAADELALPAQVQDTTFHGSHATVSLVADGVAMRTEVPARRTPANGERVTALLRRDALWCLPAGRAEDQLRGDEY